MSDPTTETELTHRRSLCLEITIPDAASYAVSLAGKDEVILGRSRSVDVQLGHRSVSREHVRVRLQATIEVEDLGSSNGTRLRGKALAVNQRAEVGIGEIIEVGSVTVRILPERSRERAREFEPRRPGSGRNPLDVPEGWYAPSSPAMQAVLSSLERVAASDLGVLLLGETGVGKQVCAELVHRRSLRAGRAFLRLGCRAVPEAQLESELFGHEAGAVEGATSARVGCLESANGGTLFLDEIAELPAALQIKLLRVLDRRELTRLGGRVAKEADVRFIAATHKDLAAEAAAGRFRQDLFYRLAAVTIQIPPLRERVDEIVPLAGQFLEGAARRYDRPMVAISAEAATALDRHPWPGNIRELRNVIERAFVVCGAGPVRVEHLLLDSESKSDSALTGPLPRLGNLSEEVEDLERRRIEAALVAAGGNQSEAARRLGMSRGALLARLRAWGLISRSSSRR